MSLGEADVKPQEGKPMFTEMDMAVLSRDLLEKGLKKGDVGAIVHAYTDRATYEVEFVAADGRTVALLTLTERDIRSISGREILHMRKLERAA